MFLHGDHLGSTSLTTDASGSVKVRQWYYPYGEQRAATGALLTDYNFTGQKLDSSTNLLYYGARYYDPLLGRFVSADTVVPEPRNPQALNRYSNCHNNPLKYVDPDGHCPLIPIIIVAALVVGGLAVTAYTYNESDSSTGFWLQGSWNADQARVLGGTIDAYGQQLGGQDHFRDLMYASQNGHPVPVVNDTTKDGANSGIELGVGTFSLYPEEPGTYAKYDNYGATSPEARAQIVFGHEIDHRLFALARARGVDPGEKYAAMVSPNGRAT